MYSKTKTERSTANDYSENGYLKTIRKGIEGVRRFGRRIIRTTPEPLNALQKALAEADAIVIGAGAGLSTSAGYTYSGERFLEYFSDFHEKYGFTDMYSGGFYPYESKEIFWAYWSRYIYVNRYTDIPGTAYRDLLKLVQDRDYFVITTNVDHCFQKAGFDKQRLFYTQGDYGLFQSTGPDNRRTYDNHDWVIRAIEAQGLRKDETGVYRVPKDGSVTMEIPSELIPVCPDDGYAFTLNLRSDDSFLEDEGWHRASARYADFLRRHEKLRVLYLELGVGDNTPVIIKYPFWQLTHEQEQAVYCCVNSGDAWCPAEIGNKAILLKADISEVLSVLTEKAHA